MAADARPVIAVVGPTASGKSALAIALAREFGGEVVSADSMQVYKGMDIGTAKVPVAERVVKHHGIDLVDPGEPYSAALYQAYARGVFEDLRSQGTVPVLCGGTGFYVRAAVDDYGFAEGCQVGNAVRDEYLRMLDEEGPMGVWEELRTLDENSAERIHPNDSKRVIRALEMHFSGESYAERLDRLHDIPQSVPAVFVGIDVEPELLRGRIESRVDAMREEGLVGEVKGLIERGFRDGVTAKHAIGYKEVAAALDGKTSMDEAFESIKAATRRYAKRQRTWFRGDGRITWIDGDSQDVGLMLDAACEAVSKDDGWRIR